MSGSASKTTRILEHRIKVAAIYYSREVFAEADLRFVQTEFPLAAAASKNGSPRLAAIPWYADLLVVDGTGRYLLVELKKGALRSGRGESPLEQIGRYRRVLGESLGSAAAQRFRFAIGSGEKPPAGVVEEAHAEGVELVVVPRTLQTLEPTSKVVPGRMPLDEAGRLRPKLVYSLAEALRERATEPAITRLTDTVTQQFLSLFPEHSIELDAKPGLRGIQKPELRLNLTCPFQRAKRLAQIHVRREWIRFDLDLTAVRNDYTGEELPEPAVRMYDNLMSPLTYGWTHTLKIETGHDLRGFDSVLRKLRQDVDSLWRPDLRRAPEPAGTEEKSEDEYWDPKGDEA